MDCHCHLLCSTNGAEVVPGGAFDTVIAVNAETFGIQHHFGGATSWVREQGLHVESPNTDMLLHDLLLITHHYTLSNSKTS